MSEHRRRPEQPDGGGRPGGHRGAPGWGPPGGEPPRMTRAEMRRSAAAGPAGRGPGRRPGGTRAGGGGTRGGGAATALGGARGLIDYPRAGRVDWRRWIPSGKQISALVLSAFALVLGAVGYVYATVSIPSVNPSTQLQDNVLYWADGSQMASVGQVNRQNVTLADVPRVVQWDFLAAENASFYTDSGVDPQGILRALYHMAQGGEVQSGSTITQQFVKNAYLDQQQTLTRKFKEIMISLKIGQSLSKQEILQGYLNTCYFGRGANGIEAAAQTYYHVHASQLNVSQGAFLAATVNEPSVLMNADSDPQAKARAEGRWTYVLDRMVAIGQLSPAERAHWAAAGFPVPKPQGAQNAMGGQIGYLVQTAEDYVKAHSSVTDQDLSHGGYQIHTTFDRRRVSALSAAVNRTQAQHLDPAHRSADRNVQFGAASVDPASGAILALYGGPGWDKGHYTDNANTVGVPVGSTFKPFDLAAALDHGAVMTPGQAPQPITPDSKFNGDDGIQIKNQDGVYLTDKGDPTGMLHQHNDTPQKWGYITLRKAMEESVNTPYVQLGEYVGYSHVRDEAVSAGLLKDSLQSDSAGFYIGTSTPSAIRMADAYATFDAHGLHHDPYSVTKVVYQGTELSGFDRPTPLLAMPSSTADTVTNVLQGVVERGTGTNAQALGRPVAGKTGTTDDYKSAWFIGYTPQLVTAVTMFKEDPQHPTLQSMSGVGGFTKVFGGVMPTEVWTRYMTEALRGMPALPFPAAPRLGLGADEPGAPSAAPSAAPGPLPQAPPGACRHRRSLFCVTGGQTATANPTAAPTFVFPSPTRFRKHG